MNDNLEDDLESAYCKSCGSCGESECCSPFKCLQESVEKNKDCKFGKEHLKEVKLYYELGIKLYNLILEKGNIENVKVVNEIYDDLFNRLYKNN